MLYPITLPVPVDQQTARTLADIAKLENQSRSAVIRDALREYISRTGYPWVARDVDVEDAELDGPLTVAQHSY